MFWMLCCTLSIENFVLRDNSRRKLLIPNIIVFVTETQGTMLKKIDFTTKQKSGPGSKVDFEVFLLSIAVYMYMFIETLLIIMDSTSAWFISPNGISVMTWIITRCDGACISVSLGFIIIYLSLTDLRRTVMMTGVFI